MTSSITRCPKCKTTFRVTQKQLQSAKGAVRCGSCLHIFDARENFLKRTPEKPKPETEPEPVAPVPETTVAQPTAAPKAPTKATPEAAAMPVNQLAFDQNAIDTEAEDDSEDFLISDDMEPEEPSENRYDEGLDDLVEFKLDSGQNNWLDDNQSLFDSTRKSKPAEEDESIEDTDESWALKMLEDEHNSEETIAKPQDPYEQATQSPQEQSFEEQFSEERPLEESSFGEQAFEERSFDEEFDQSLDDSSNDRFDGSRTGSFDSLSDFNEDDFDNFGESNNAQDSQQSDFERDLEDIFREDEDITQVDYSLNELNDGDESHLEDSYVPDSNDRQDLLNALEPAPLEMTFEQKNERRWLIKTAFITGNVVLLLALIVQIGYLKFDTWSRVEPYRHWYALACPIFNCTLPTRHDYEKIRITLVVRSHPEVEDALVADAILLNTAEFQQPFPSLAIRFSDINDNPLAERIFSPGEYLHGELAGAQQMPKGQPVHISLQVADPGSEAVNYRAFIPIR